MIAWGGWLLVLYGLAHTALALTLEGAAGHADAWFGGELWGEDLAHPSADGSAYWLSLNSFGPPLALLGALVLRLDRRGVAPPAFVAWAVGGWAVVDGVVSGPTPWPVPLLAAVLIGLGARRAASAPSDGPA